MAILVVGDPAWADAIPDWLREKVIAEQEIEALAFLLGKDLRGGLATETEAAAALMTLSFSAPLDHDATEIYLYLCTRLMEERGREVPPDIAVRALSEYQQHILTDIRGKIYRRRGKASTALTDALKVISKERKQRPTTDPAPMAIPTAPVPQRSILDYF